MKKNILLTLAFFSVCQFSFAQLIFEDRFEYPQGDLEGQGGWALGTGQWTSGESPTVSDKTLKYSYYAGSESKSVKIEGTGINRITYRTISESGINKGSVYVAMLINLESVDRVRDFISFDAGTGNSPKAKIFIKNNGTGFSIGASMADPNVANFSRGLAYKAVHLIVLKYTFIKKEEGTEIDCNDRIELFVNPNPNLSESKQTAVKLDRRRDDKDSDMKTIKAINIRQTGVKGYISGIRVASSWNSVIR